MKPLMGLAAALAVGACALSPGAPPSAEAAVEQFMWDYTKAWNRHDAAAIAQDFYRLGPTVEAQTASLQRTFESLRGQGYHHSDIFEVKGCLTGPDTAWAGMKYSRLKENGEPLPPKDRAGGYLLTKFEDGWRITRMGAGGASADQPLACPEG